MASANDYLEFVPELPVSRRTRNGGIYSQLIETFVASGKPHAKLKSEMFKAQLKSVRSNLQVRLRNHPTVKVVSRDNDLYLTRR